MSERTDEAERELANWGRCIHDGWLRDHLGFTPPPTSEGYLTPPWDEPEPVRPPLDELAAQETTDIVVQIGLTYFDSYRVLVYWYTKLQQIEGLTHAESIKRLSKHMRTGYSGAERMLDQARLHYRQYRLQSSQKVG